MNIKDKNEVISLIIEAWISESAKLAGYGVITLPLKTLAKLYAAFGVCWVLVFIICWFFNNGKKK